MESVPAGSEESAFLWLAPFAPPRGWTRVPPGGMCLCAYLFVMKGGKILLGKYADHPAWKELCGMEPARIRANAHGWTLPASHVKFGEDPRETARRIGEEILMLDRGLVYSEPFVKTFLYEPAIAPGEKHYDVLFLFDVSAGEDVQVRKPPWYAALEWCDVGRLPRNQFARQHDDVAEAWLIRRGEGFKG
ncbi:MAG: NUDIX domain-containing protein [Deltaproteobacteria bacterium]|nr:NUDIX domain-containing protein [Deltaproteobacteria bacterium]